MLWAGALTAPFGLTEFLFVSAYWNPPTLFDLAYGNRFENTREMITRRSACRI